jgi:hypothetical protein
MKSLCRPTFFSVLAILLAGCGTVDAHSPTLDVVGSYFPAWMVCIILGLAFTVIVRQILVGLKIDAHLRPRGLVYLSMIILWTLTAWLVWFKN